MELIDFILHVDEHLLEFIKNYGVWIYAILFLIIFVETGLVVMPFLPGDSLLFAAGALAASTGAMDPWVLGVLLFIAAVRLKCQYFSLASCHVASSEYSVSLSVPLSIPQFLLRPWL
jgi:uncharacterized membrane protein YdjX (TVP38/TMEM64 family)